jgi:Fe-S oxidoreductase
MASLLCGSEGTLAVVTEVEVSLEPVPATKAVGLLAYEDLGAAVRDVEPILTQEPAAVELVDDVLVDLAANTAEFEDVVTMLPEGTRAVLLVEFYAADDREGRRKVADLLADRAPDVRTEAEPSADRAVADAPVNAFAALEAHDAETRERFWTLRKSGLPILLSRTTDDKHASFIEDCAVAPGRLPEYVERFEAILDRHDTDASFYAHAGPGVLHVRPLVNTKTVEGVETMASIADAVTDLVVELGGSVSGEHGDGRARSQWNRKLYGVDLQGTFRDLKEAFDPDWLLNPGQVVGYDDPDAGVTSGAGPTRSDDASSAATRDGSVDSGEGVPDRARTVRLTENHRFGPEYEFEAGFEPALHWENDGGFQGMAELCHGCGGCRGGQDTTGGVMCPTYRASEEEITTTRGRANALRQAMSGDLPEDPFRGEFFEEVMDLCIGCKGCKRDCPSEVDMAKLKVELTHEYHRREGAGAREKLFASVDRLARLASATAPVSNWLTRLPGADLLAETLLGIARERDLPEFRRETLRDWFADRGPRVPPAEAERTALLFPDTYTNFSHPETGKAAVEVLEAAGVHVRLADRTDSGRPAFSKGFLDRARATAEDNVAALAPRLRDGWDLVVVEPSDAVMFQSDYPDLLGEDPDAEGPADVTVVAKNTYGVCEYLDWFDLDRGVEFAAPDEHLSYHGHCHQKATKRDHHAVAVLRRAGYAVDALDSGCCGMAGSFGYEAEHYAMSRSIGEILFGQLDDSSGDVVVAPGTSCRTQVGDHEGEQPAHPVELLAAALA